MQSQQCFSESVWINGERVIPMENITEVLSTISAWATSATIILAALSAIFKPIRNAIMWLFRKVVGTSGNEKVINEIKIVEEKLSEKIEAVSENCDLNERDRLQQIIFNYGNFARRKQEISGEEFRFLQRAFKKYACLGGNDIAHDEYIFIENYYNNSGWEEK